MHQFTILTCTYNRAQYLPRIYERLCQQDDIDFEWVIVDDGSSDNTKEVISSFEKKFEIKYIYQENTGLPAAMNNGTQNADSYLITKLDDDDLLLPQALIKVWNYFDVKTGRFEHGCVCLSGLNQYYDTGNLCGDKFPHDYHVSDVIRYIKNKKIKGDTCDFFITEISKKYPYPVIEGEKNIRPSLVYHRIALKYKTLYVNQVFGEKNYYEDGLTAQKYIYKYPIGAEIFFNESSIPPFRLGLQIYHSSRYIFFAKINKKKNIFRNAKNKIIFPLGLCRYYMGVCKKFLKKEKVA